MNAYPRVVLSEGLHHICLYAQRDIKKYEEITFDYDGKDELCNDYDWINDQHKKPKNIPVEKEINKNSSNLKKQAGKKSLIRKNRLPERTRPSTYSHSSSNSSICSLRDEETLLYSNNNI